MQAWHEKAKWHDVIAPAYRWRLIRFIILQTVEYLGCPPFFAMVLRDILLWPWPELVANVWRCGSRILHSSWSFLEFPSRGSIFWTIYILQIGLFLTDFLAMKFRTILFNIPLNTMILPDICEARRWDAATSVGKLGEIKKTNNRRFLDSVIRS